MSKVSESIQRGRYMDDKGHNQVTIEVRDVKVDRKLVRICKDENNTKSN